MHRVSKKYLNRGRDAYHVSRHRLSAKALLFSARWRVPKGHDRHERHASGEEWCTPFSSSEWDGRYANVPRAGNSVLHPLSLLAYFYSSLSVTRVGSSPFPLKKFSAAWRLSSLIVRRFLFSGTKYAAPPLQARWQHHANIPIFAIRMPPNDGLGVLFGDCGLLAQSLRYTYSIRREGHDKLHFGKPYDVSLSLGKRQTWRYGKTVSRLGGWVK